jgi:hypothetical protein
VFIARFSYTGDTLCSREISKVESLKELVNRVHQKIGRFPESSVSLKEMLAHDGPLTFFSQDAAPKDAWGYEYKYIYLGDDAFLITSVGFERMCKQH